MQYEIFKDMKNLPMFLSVRRTTFVLEIPKVFLKIFDNRDQMSAKSTKVLLNSKCRKLKN